MAILPAWDIEASVREARRAKGLGLRGVNITSDPQDLGAPDLASRDWDPLWDTCSELELPVHFHIGASLTTMNYFGTYPWPSHDDDTKLAIGGTLLFIGNARVVVNIICSGMLDRFPELKIVSVESGCGGFRSFWRPLTTRWPRTHRWPEQPCRSPRPSTSGGRSTPPPGSSGPTCRRWWRRWARTTSCSRPTSPPDLPLPRPVEDRRRDHAGPEHRRPAQDPRRERSPAVPPLAGIRPLGHGPVLDRGRTRSRSLVLEAPRKWVLDGR